MAERSEECVRDHIPSHQLSRTAHPCLIDTLALLSDALREQEECNEAKEAELPAAFKKPNPLITAPGPFVCESSVVNSYCVILKFASVLVLASDVGLKFPAMEKLTEPELHLSVRLDPSETPQTTGFSLFGDVKNYKESLQF